ncbi:bile acid:sodium symporter family protein [Acinetobacter variabilis]|uniref:bile acid:sodium symporter family protein n=1 Tax=Acinetobacter variabilis TaxID=70346 RepID=UPI00267252BD|nr:bile acid:sodium symporter family protein [Acinetobacter variabilis]WKT72133.1 bile acid:sodium symporter family protein [Acinetobacter variabilis]
MDSGFFSLFLPITLAITMMGLGLQLTVKDFLHVSRYPKVIFIVLFSQLVILTGLTFLICLVLDLPPLLAVGMMLLAASPGGATANLLSYLYKGDVALNITLTAINTIISIFTLPFIMNLSLYYFIGQDTGIGLPLEKMAQVFLITIIPVVIGMLIRAKFPKLSDIVHMPMRLLSIAFLSMLLIYAIFQERFNIIEYFASIGIATSILCFSSLFLGYCLPLLMDIPDKMARACTFEVGIHNTTVSMTIAISVLNNITIAIPAGIYSIVMYVFAGIFGFMISQQKLSYSGKSRLSDL